MFYKWGGSDILSISTFNHYSRILKVVAVILLQKKGVPKRERSLAVPHPLQLQRMVIPAAPKVLLYIVPCQTPLIESTLGCGLFLPGIYIAACRQCVHVQPHFV